MFIVVCYDIADDRRRLQVSHELENFGERVQYSVFECHLDEGELARLQRRLAKRIDVKEDRLRYYVLCGKDHQAVLLDGQGQISQDPDYHMI